MPEDIDTIIGKKDRSEAGPTAPPQGLVLADMKIVVDTPETPGL
jgi:tRNA U38,U39,U40 pseudouridine synthase TruA